MLQASQQTPEKPKVDKSVLAESIKAHEQAKSTNTTVKK